MAHGDGARVLTVTDALVKNNYDSLSSELYEGYMTILVTKGILPVNAALRTYNTDHVACMDAWNMVSLTAESIRKNEKLSTATKQVRRLFRLSPRVTFASILHSHLISHFRHFFYFTALMPSPPLLRRP